MPTQKLPNIQKKALFAIDVALGIIINLFQLLISFVMYFPEFYKNGFRFPAKSYTTVLCFAIPAVLYSINNNLALHMLLYMDPTTFEVYFYCDKLALQFNLKLSTSVSSLIYQYMVCVHYQDSNITR